MQQRSLLAGISHPVAITGLSLLFPGLGLFISGNPRRGAFALWILGPLMIALIILGQASWLWQMNQNLGAGRIPRSALELVFIGSLLIALLATVTWIVLAMEGARHVSQLAGRVPHGQSVALALLVAIAAFHLTFEPTRFAQVLHHFAVAFRLDGLRVVPLVMELSAAKLDPMQPLYTYRAAELYQQLGQRGRASELRSELNARWTAYARTVGSTDPVNSGANAMRPILASPQIESLPIPEIAVSPFGPRSQGAKESKSNSASEAKSDAPEAEHHSAEVRSAPRRHPAREGAPLTWTWTAD
jgi:hypothetical protein